MKRKARKKKKSHESLDLMKPLQLDKLGTEEDVCFGKLHDLSADECKSCGDAEICSIVCSQKQHLKRKTIEDKTAFKDLENLTCKWQDVSKELRRILKKPKNKSGLPIPTLKTEVTKKLGIHESEFDKFLIKVLAKQPKLIKQNNLIKYKL